MVHKLSDWPQMPTNETEEQRARAKKISDEIDEVLQRERKARDKKRPARKVLLLGPSQSGKSTWLKNFQLLYAPKAFHAETGAWRAVIHLNLIRAVNFIVDELGTPLTSPTLSPAQVLPPVFPHVGELRIRLAPLRQVEITLSKCLSVDRATTRRSMSVVEELSKSETISHISIRGGSVWKGLAKKASFNSTISNELQQTRSILEACREDIIALWSEPGIREHLEEMGTPLPESSIFFLDSAKRIARKDYVPTDDDVLRARLETIGIEEHHITMEVGDAKQDWIFYDVEGSRGQRATWAPYFDDVHAIVFIVSMADFDQSDPHEPQVNRFVDSITLWKAVCQNKLINNIPMLLFLNKVDVLHTKLESGTYFADYVQDFSQANDAKSVTRYFKKLFTLAHEKYSPKGRSLHTHVTCAIDTKSMSLVLRQVKDVITMAKLKSIDMV